MLNKSDDYVETSCPVCGKAKEKLNLNDPRLLNIMREFNIKTFADFSEPAKQVLRMAKYTFTCDCVLNPMKIELARRKKNDNKQSKAKSY